MKTKFFFAAAALALSAAPSFATTVVDGSCINVADANGCKFDGNISNQNNTDDAEAAYNLYNNTHPLADPDITLNFVSQTDDFFAGKGQTSGTWSTTGLVEFLSVKAGDFFVLYQLATPASSGTWNTFNILNRNGKPLGLSHLAFLYSDGFDPDGGGVPEPATWAMLLSGFGMVGFAARRRRGLASVSA